MFSQVSCAEFGKGGRRVMEGITDKQNPQNQFEMFCVQALRVDQFTLALQIASVLASSVGRVTVLERRWSRVRSPVSWRILLVTREFFVFQKSVNFLVPSIASLDATFGENCSLFLFSRFLTAQRFPIQTLCSKEAMSLPHLLISWVLSRNWTET